MRRQVMTRMASTILKLGNRTVTLIMAIIVISLHGSAPPPVHAETTTPSAFHYQGRLADADGDPVTGGYNFIFEIFDVASDGSALWTETRNNTMVSNGVFSVELGTVTAIPMSVFNGNPRYLSITVNATPLTPRERLLSAPYAFHSYSTEVASSATNFVVYASSSEVMRATSGKVGIGTTVPAYKFDVNGGAIVRSSITAHGVIISSSGQQRITIDGVNGDGWPSILAENATNLISWQLGVTDVIATNVVSLFSRSNHGLLFGTNQTERMRFTSSGLMGVNTVNPVYKLDVNGDAVVRSSLTVTGGSLTGSSPIFKVAGDTLTVTGGGYVGVGTPVPLLPLHVYTPTSNTSLLVEGSNAGTGASGIAITHTSASPANGDEAGRLAFIGYDDGSNNTTYGQITVDEDDVANGSEDASMIFKVFSAGSSVETLRLKSGNVGIGTNDPGGYKLYVAGTGRFDCGGGVLWTDRTTYIECVDIAEVFESGEALEPGDVVSLDEQGGIRLFKSSASYDNKVVGVYSTSPGLLVGDSNKNGVILGPGQNHELKSNEIPLALAGRVPVKVTLEGGPIKPGDMLTSSSKPGYAMKATRSGRVIGMAMETFDGQKTKEGKVLVFVNPHYWVNAHDARKQTEELIALKQDIAQTKKEIELLKNRIARER
ncbi:MAG: hypothetical protein AABZ44_07530 [Elusimicrobiota bacterium]